MEELVDKVFKSRAYWMFVFFVIMPVNGIILHSGKVFLALIFMAMNAPGFYLLLTYAKRGWSEE
jgi:hypothetical protein